MRALGALPKFLRFCGGVLLPVLMVTIMGGFRLGLEVLSVEAAVLSLVIGISLWWTTRRLERAASK